MTVIRVTRAPYGRLFWFRKFEAYFKSVIKSITYELYTFHTKAYKSMTYEQVQTKDV